MPSVQPELAEELDAINAIYDPSTILICPNPSSNSAEYTETINTTIVLHIPEHPQTSFILRFDNKYPETIPHIVGIESTESREDGKRRLDILSEILQKVWAPGSVCLYDLILEAGEKFDELNALEEEAQHKESQKDYTAEGDYVQQLEDLDINAQTSGEALLSTFGLDSPPSWVLSDPISEKKSVFIARAAHVKSKEQAEKYLDYLLATERKVAAATHNITAWRIRQKKADGTDSAVQDFDDDGESAAGGRMLHLMQLMDVWDVVVVVTRWYGGVKLGPDRFRLINGAARDALVKGGFDTTATDNQERKKKKGKK